MTILIPRAIGPAQNHTLFSGTKAYRQNKGLDADSDLRVDEYEAAAVRAREVQERAVAQVSWLGWRTRETRWTVAPTDARA